MTGKRRQSGGGPLRRQSVNEDDVAKRFTASTLNMTECARRFGITLDRVKRILEERGIDPGRRVAEPDAVVKAYAQMGSVQSAASVTGTSLVKVREILDGRSIPRHERPRPAGPVAYRRQATR